MKFNRSNIIFGTANLCSKYGHKSKFISESKSRGMLDFAYKKEIRTLDISSNYDCYDFLIKKYNFNKWKISFKISKKDINTFSSKLDIENFLNNLLLVFKKKKIEYFLFHSSKDIYTKKGRLIFKVLQKFKQNNKIGKIGVSVYTKIETINFIKEFKIDVIQLPFNILDQRFNDRKLIKTFKDKKIEIHARSIFLQGILVDKKIVPKKLLSFLELQKWFLFLKKNNLKSISEILNFINQHKFINKIVFGVRTVKQLNQIIGTKLINKKVRYQNFSSKKKILIDPLEWLKASWQN